MRRPTLAEQLGPFEVFPDRELAPGRPIVARLIGRRFETLFDSGQYDRPYDARLGRGMVKALAYMATTLGASFGFVEPTELSLFAVANGGDARRLLSRIAGEGSGKLSLILGQVVTFEARLYEFPSVELAQEYFRWRQDEAQARCVDRYCRHALAQSGADPAALPRILDGLGSDERIELLRQNGFDFQKVPGWQRLGASIRLRPGEEGGSDAARLLVDLNLPSADAFGDYLRQALAS